VTNDNKLTANRSTVPRHGHSPSFGCRLSLTGASESTFTAPPAAASFRALAPGSMTTSSPLTPSLVSSTLESASIIVLVRTGIDVVEGRCSSDDGAPSMILTFVLGPATDGPLIDPPFASDLRRRFSRLRSRADSPVSSSISEIVSLIIGD
jgi:hypothetical protein